jgi:hypothetical protein
MSSITFQTVKLSRGRHASAEDGACTMELASMLAGESFTDHPASACPVLGSLLRAYNDLVDDERRQDLYAYASRVVGSRESIQVQRARADRVAEWARRRWQRRRARSVLPARLRLIGVERRPPIDVLGVHAVRAVSKTDDATHAAVLALLDELLAMRESGESRSSAMGQTRVHACTGTAVDGDGALGRNGRISAWSGPTMP